MDNVIFYFFEEFLPHLNIHLSVSMEPVKGRGADPNSYKSKGEALPAHVE